MTLYEHHYYGGAWHTPSSSDTIEVISSATEEPVGARRLVEPPPTSMPR